MRIYLASFLQPENFGPGKLIGIINANGGKPKMPVDGLFEPFTPSIEILNKYNEMRSLQDKEAGKIFVESYERQLEHVCNNVIALADAAELPEIEVLPFQDGDTLASWERAEFTNYRKVLAPYLKKLGFEVILK